LVPSFNAGFSLLKLNMLLGYIMVSADLALF
jgi:hypothetical protein